MSGRFLLVPGFALAVLLSPAPVMADGGRITTATGDVTLSRQREVQKVERGTVVLAGDQIQTAAGGSAQLWMQDDSLLAIGAASNFRVEQFAPSQHASRYSLEQGGLRAVSGSLKPVIATPAAEITAIGTDLTGVICAQQCGSAPKGLYVVVDKGQVKVANGAGSVEAKTGQIVFSAGPTSAPRIIAKKPAGVDIAMAGFDFNLELVEFDSDSLVQPLPVIPGDDDPSPSTR